MIDISGGSAYNKGVAGLSARFFLWQHRITRFRHLLLLQAQDAALPFFNCCVKAQRKRQVTQESLEYFNNNSTVPKNSLTV